MLTRNLSLSQSYSQQTEKNINNRREFTVNFSSLEFVKKAYAMTHMKVCLYDSYAFSRKQLICYD